MGSFHPCRTLVFVRSHARFVVVVLGVRLADGIESPWRVGLTDGIESPTVILRVTGFCVPAQRCTKTRASQRKPGATSLGHSKRHQGLRREPLASTSMPHSSMRRRLIWKSHQRKRTCFSMMTTTPNSTGTAVAEAVVPTVFTLVRNRMCAPNVPLFRTCQAFWHPLRSWR